MGRGKKYDSLETEKLCLAYVKASHDPTRIGADKQDDEFWALVQQKLIDVSPTNCLPGTYKHRSVEAFKTYLREQIFPSVNKFLIILRRVHTSPQTTGLTELEKINIAVAIHLGKIEEPDRNYRIYESVANWKPFTAWYNVLRKEPKWNPTWLVLQENTTNAADSNSTTHSHADGVAVAVGGGSDGESETEDRDGADAEQPDVALTPASSRKRGASPGRAGTAKRKPRQEKLNSELIQLANRMTSVISSYQSSCVRDNKIRDLQTLMQMAKQDDDEEEYKRVRDELKDLLRHPEAVFM